MSSARRQLLGACLGVFLLLLLYRYHRTNGILLSPQYDAKTTLNVKINPKYLWRKLPVRYPVVDVQPLPVTLPQTLPQVQLAASKLSHLKLDSQTSRQSAAKEAFERCWKSYQSLAWGADEFAPLSGTPTNKLGGWGATLIDNLDTLWIMGMHDEFKKAVGAVTNIKFEDIQLPEINTHDVNIRLLGGLLAAFDLSADLKLLEKAIELGDMLYVAFDTPNRMPIIHWNARKAARKEEQLAEESVLGAELGSFTLEFTRLSQITGDPKYFDAAQRVMELFDKQQNATKLVGLWPVSVNARDETFDDDVFTLGAEASSLYKTLPQAYALVGGQVPMYRKMYENVTLTAAGLNLFRPMTPEGKKVLISGTVRVNVTEYGNSQIYLESQMQYRSCFAGGMFALGGALLNIPAHKEIAHKLVDGCIWAHQVIPMGIMPEVFDVVSCASETDCPWSELYWKQEAWKKANSLEPEPNPNLNVDTFIKDHRLPKGFTGIQNTSYNLRPEAIESMFTLYRVTGREDLLDAAWDMFQAIQSVTQTKNGNAAIVSVTDEGSDVTPKDSMDSTWMSQTLKYFYLIFSSPDLISLDEHGAHFTCIYIMTIIESTRLRPAHQLTPTSTPLSILDATVARFVPAGAIWIFNQPADLDQKILIDNLRTSFIETLSKFPQWAGQLQWAPVNPEGNHTERFNRPLIVYGTETDPGVEWTVIEHPLRANEIVPTAEERASGTASTKPGAWVGDDFNPELFISSNPLALSNLRDYVGLPGMQVQISLLQDGYVIGIKLAHCLADAQAVMVFVHLWAYNSKTQFGTQPESPLTGDPLFDPALLDSCAAGDIDSPEPDQTIVQTARQLPLHRYSWWDSGDEGYPSLFIPITENSKPPAEINHKRLSPSEPAPWLSWDLSKPVRYTQLHFTGAELREFQALALNTGRRCDISRLDALLAHVWIAITRARGQADSTKPVYLNLSLGARARVSPALPDTFIGSPLFLTHIGGVASSTCRETLGEIATQIRETMKGFTADAVGAMLHDAAHEVSPQRLWQGFLGSEHTLVTSWLRLRLYEVDFAGTTPRYVHSVMPKMDGCVQVMDSGVGDGGMDVALYLDEVVTERFLGGCS
ncbi:unnamed protein product [Penicillium glandicola]